MFSEAEESTPRETVSEDDSQEERERKERIPQRKADISRCWSKYCLDLLKSSRDKLIQELRNSNQGDEDRNTEQGLKIYFCLLLFVCRRLWFSPYLNHINGFREVVKTSILKLQPTKPQN